jgi:hypothetical protein
MLEPMTPETIRNMSWKDIRHIRISPLGWAILINFGFWAFIIFVACW